MSELLGQGKTLVGGQTGLQFGDVSVVMARAHIYLSGSKSDKSNQGCTVTLDHVVNHADVCPLLALSDYMRRRPGQPGPFFVHKMGNQSHAINSKRF